ncbi:hypothetical protein ACTIVE_4013 [Actinomadura verrucosospora]|uniref:Carboxypeptidase regulatory-like domain-containing protein n=1 Tax=Actinomadura verrucosospora TaxID=46165 RepID=A0A7D3VTJ2_ACTVE|nr:hypothetical protein ACTIVE_4013 [Actinomadura verrucosospora]
MLKAATYRRRIKNPAPSTATDNDCVRTGNSATGSERPRAMRRAWKIAAVTALGLLALGAVEPAWLFSAASGSGLTGQTTVGPMCPVQRVGQVCPVGHVRMSAVVTRHDWPGVAAFIRTDGQGRFRVHLAPGRYTIHVVRSPWRSSPTPFLRRSTIPVTVHSHAYARVDVGYDSGIR